MKPEQAAPPGSPVLPRGRAGSWPPRVRHSARHPQNTFGSVPLGWHCLLTPALSGTLCSQAGDCGTPRPGRPQAAGPSRAVAV